MAGSSNCCKCIAAASGTSSSDFTAHCTCNRHNAPHCVQYNFLCGRNYAILRKICNKIFKDFIRSKCREKYTIFDGGNSINVRIHRSESRDAENARRNRENAPNYRSKRNLNKIDVMSKSERQIYCQSADKKIRSKLHENRDEDDADRKKSKRKQKQFENRHCNRHREDDTETVTNKKEENQYNKRGALKQDDNSSETRSNIKKRHRRHEINSGETYSTLATKENLSNEIAENKKKDLNHDSQGKKLKGREKKADFEDEFIAVKRGNKRNLNDDKRGSFNLRDDKNNNVKLQERDKSSRNLNVINDLRVKVRRGDKFLFDREPRKPKNSKSQYRDIKHSRADEVTSCDFLRAQMEQRDIRKLHCQLKSGSCPSYACSSKMCTPNFNPRKSTCCNC